MKRFVPLFVIAAIAIGGFIIDRNRQAHDSEVSGFFESQPTRIASRVGGRVAKILVKEGDTVKAGQALVELDAEPNVQSTDALAANAQQLEEQFKKIRAGNRPEDIERQAGIVGQARAALDKLTNGALPEDKRQADDKVAQARSRYLKSQRGSSPDEIKQAEAVMNQALARYQQAQRGLTKEERAQLQARLASAQASEDMAKQDLDRYTKLVQEGASPAQRLEQAQTTYDQAVNQRKDAEEAVRRANLGTPKEELEQSRQAYLQAQAQFRLVKDGPRKEDTEAALQDLKIAEAQRDLVYRGSRQEDIASAQAKLASEEATLRLLKVGNRPEDIAAAKAQWQAAQAQLASSKAVVSERKIVAPRDGVIEKIDLAVGDLIASSAPVAEMSAADDIWIRVYLPEDVLAKFKVGDDAELKVDGVAEALTAKVDSIARQGEFTPANLQTPEERGRQVFGVRLRLTKPEGRVRAGMYATVKRIGRWP